MGDRWGMDWAQGCRDTEEPPLPVCESCGRAVDAVNATPEGLLCDRCLERYILAHWLELAEKLVSREFDAFSALCRKVLAEDG